MSKQVVVLLGGEKEVLLFDKSRLGEFVVFIVKMLISFVFHQYYLSDKHGQRLKSKGLSIIKNPFHIV